MLTTLFHIPSRIPWGAGSLPLFGFGILLAVVVAEMNLARLRGRA